MILYHSSNVVIENPDVLHSRDFLDFGNGFYLTSIREQAESYAMRFVRRNQPGYINEYSLSIDSNEWKILEFKSYDLQWLDFVTSCRKGLDTTDFDMIIGGIANDKVIRTLDRYFEGTLTAEQTLGILKYERPNIQFCLRSQKLINECLSYIRSSKI